MKEYPVLMRLKWEERMVNDSLIRKKWQGVFLLEGLSASYMKCKIKNNGRGSGERRDCTFLQIDLYFMQGEESLWHL